MPHAVGQLPHSELILSIVRKPTPEPTPTSKLQKQQTFHVNKTTFMSNPYSRAYSGKTGVHTFSIDLGVTRIFYAPEG
jgi:hypothetical protein